MSQQRNQGLRISDPKYSNWSFLLKKLKAELVTILGYSAGFCAIPIFFLNNSFRSSYYKRIYSTFLCFLCTSWHHLADIKLNWYQHSSAGIGGGNCMLPELPPPLSTFLCLSSLPNQEIIQVSYDTAYNCKETKLLLYAYTN